MSALTAWKNYFVLWVFKRSVSLSQTYCGHVLNLVSVFTHMDVECGRAEETWLISQFVLELLICNSTTLFSLQADAELPHHVRDVLQQLSLEACQQI